MYDTFLFDLDGTLTDSAEGIINSAYYALTKYGIKVDNKSELKKFIGPPLADSFIDFYGFSKEESVKAVNVFREYFTRKGIFENRLYENADEVLKALKQNGKKVVLATSKPEKFAIEILKHFNIFKYFDFVSGATMDGSRVEKSDVINYIFDNFNADKKNSVMIGDREHDIIGANICGIDSIGVLYGFGNLSELRESGATHIISDIKEITEYI